MGKKLERKYKCRFNCKKEAYTNENYRNNHETHCKLNPKKGTKPRFEEYKGKYTYIK